MLVFKALKCNFIVSLCSFRIYFSSSSISVYFTQLIRSQNVSFFVFIHKKLYCLFIIRVLLMNKLTRLLVFIRPLVIHILYVSFRFYEIFNHIFLFSNGIINNILFHLLNIIFNGSFIFLNEPLHFKVIPNTTFIYFLIITSYLLKNLISHFGIQIL